MNVITAVVTIEAPLAKKSTPAYCPEPANIVQLIRIAHQKL